LVVLIRLIHDFVDFCYPGVCASCKAGCEAGEFLCHECGKQLSLLEEAAACDRCAMPVAYPEAPCPFCQGKGEPHYERILRLGIFEDPLKDLIHQMKYSGRWNVGESLAARLLSQERIANLVSEADVLVPVPLHFFRQFRRGYNQAMVVARWMSRKQGKPIVHPLRRVRHTETQTHLHSRQKRFKNLRDAFKLVNPAAVHGKRVLVIDDVMTTGATLQTVARALRPARPASLSAIVLAVADPRGRSFQSV
jgi:ComF family protein